ncbi:hypothetical protein E2C06_02660 [Dankookia rubra]|uniref:Uncharacterized protein n=1 Tax=Dankookia rubra TaxID=1442381 RepID=A0A4R5QN07_9PROT|nr:hypothetical protein [Dankookia rubra]TDH64258.1 hypothetical protein E2C06_02660 [Dankookia rubra]
MSFYELAVIVAGIAMGVWLDRLLGPARRLGLLALGAAALGGLLLLGQDWAGMALGCLLGARLVPVRAPRA